MSLQRGAGYFAETRIIPVLSPVSAESAVTISRILLEAGLRVQEITLRSDISLHAIAALKQAVPGLCLGAGTVLTPQQGESAIEAGASFLVSPGMTDGLAEFAVDCNVPFLPGVSTLSEMMRARELGCEVAKLFPAQILGGVSFLRSLAGPLPSMKFCPTGGIDAALAPSYLALGNVLAVGGSWMAPPELIAEGRLSEIKRLADCAAAL